MDGDCLGMYIVRTPTIRGQSVSDDSRKSVDECGRTVRDAFSIMRLHVSQGLLDAKLIIQRLLLLLFSLSYFLRSLVV